MNALPVRAWRLGTAGVVGLAAAGCAGLPVGADQASMPKVTPVLRFDAGPMSAEGAYAAGRSALNDGRLYLALMHFEQAAALRPEWADPVNGKVVALARLGRVSEALDFADRAAARGLRSAELEQNLVFLMARQGRPVPVVTAVESPQPAPVATATVVAAAPAQTTPVPAEPPVMPVVVASDVRPDSGPRWLQKAPNVLELKMDLTTTAVAAAPVPAAQPVATAAAEPEQLAVVSTPRLRMSTMGIEVSNGAGRTGLAKGTADALRTAGMKPWRITNHSNYNIAQTEVQYRSADDAPAARQLARKMGVSVVLVQNPALHASVNLRVVLGSDVAALAPAKRVLADAPAQLELFNKA